MEISPFASRCCQVSRNPVWTSSGSGRTASISGYALASCATSTSLVAVLRPSCITGIAERFRDEGIEIPFAQA